MMRSWLLAMCLLALLTTPTVANNPLDLLGNRDKFFRPQGGAQVPTDLTFRDHNDRLVRLSDYSGKPIILVLAYYRCPMLCPMVFHDLVKALRGVPLDPGTDYTVVVVSFDPNEDRLLQPDTNKLVSAVTRDRYIEEFGRPGTEHGWHFLTGKRDQIEQLQKAVGFFAIWDEQQKQYAHARGLTILSPDWKVSRYFIEGDYSGKSIRQALIDASEGKVSKLSFTDRVVLMCFKYDPSTGKYSLQVLRLIQFGGIVTIVCIVLFWLINWVRGRRAAAVRTNLQPTLPAGV